MTKIGLPPKQGLYDPGFEHDACGIGFVANIKGVKSHEIVKQALRVLCNLDHRGGQGSEPNTGDGAGLLMQIPDTYLQSACEEENIKLPAAGSYGVGMVYLPQDLEARQACESIIERIVKQEGQQFLGWRTVPTDNSSLGDSAKSAEPFVRQVFIGQSEDVTSNLDFERKLYIIRKLSENAIKLSHRESQFYYSSLSSRTIVYKGMLTPEQVDAYYLELQDEKVDSALALVHSRFSTNTFPSWERAHPYRYLIHNGEINTLRGNVNWMHARQAMCATELFGEDIEKIKPVIDPDGSDTAMFDNTLEFLMLVRPFIAACSDDDGSRALVQA